VAHGFFHIEKFVWQFEAGSLVRVVHFTIKVIRYPHTDELFGRCIASPLNWNLDVRGLSE